MSDEKYETMPTLTPQSEKSNEADAPGSNDYKSNYMLELELAKMRIVQIEKEIELERLRQASRECSDHNKSPYKPSTSHAVAISPNDEFVRAMSKFLDMPKREIIKFDGNPVNYWNFIKNFEDLVDNDAIGYRTKLNYLIQYCEGEAKDVIKHCVLLEPEEGYYKALELLEEAFGQKHVVARTFIDKLLEFPNVKTNDAALLRKLSHEMQACELTLKQMNYVSDLNSGKTIEQLVLKLPVHSQREWIKVACNVIKNGREPSFGDLSLFVKEQSDMANTRYGLLINSHSTGKNSKEFSIPTKKNPDSKHRVFATRLSENNVEKPDNDPKNEPRLFIPHCILCSGGHFLDQCSQFKDKDIDERLAFVSKRKLCNVCLKANHIAKNCRSPRSCTVEGCGWRHHTLLHRSQELSDDIKNDVHINAQQGSDVTLHKTPTSGTAFAIVPILARYNGNVVQTCAFLDSGSDATLVTEDLARELGLVGVTKTVSLKTLGSQSTLSCKQVQLEVSPLDSSLQINVSKAWTVQRLPQLQRVVPKADQMASWSHLDGIALPEVKNEEIKMLIGCNVPEAHITIDKRLGGDNEPCAVKTPLGWTLLGPYRKTPGKSSIVNHTLATEEIEAMFERFYKNEFDDVSGHVPMSVEDRKALSIMSESIQLVDGHYQIALPWRGRQMLPNNRKLAISRLNSLRKRLCQDSDLHKEYTNVMSQYIERGFAEMVEEDHVNEQVWYLPHHPVFHPKKPNKLRIVFDCAAEYAGISLNKNLYSGPDLVNNLVDVFMRFRQRSIGITADIEAMFHQVIVPSRDRNALRFLWWVGGDVKTEPAVYRMKVHIFGATSSPSCATFALQRTIADNAEKFDERVIQVAREQFYVDDLLTSVNTLDEGKLIYTQLKQILKLGGFNLTKWTSNNRELMKFIPEEDRAERNIDILLCKENNERTLGIEWNVFSDSICFRTREFKTRTTRRTLLSYVASIFDPVGIIAPILLPAKLILQDTCRRRLEWDADLPEDCLNTWNRWYKNINYLNKIRIPRCIMPTSCEPLSIQLHCFSDASEFAYGAVVYIRVEDVSHQVHCSLLLAKSRVAPLKSVTIPRLELVAAVLCLKIGKHLQQQLRVPISSTTYWTDSLIVLHSIKNTTKRFERFVSSRLAVIHELSTPDQWRHINSKQNPADYASRGLSLDNEVKINEWLYGPQFLRDREEDWSYIGEDESASSNNVLVDETCGSNTLQEQGQLLDRFKSFTSWFKILRVFALCQHFIRNLKMRKAGKPSIAYKLSLEDIRKAKMNILKLVQSATFPDEIEALRSAESDCRNIVNDYEVRKVSMSNELLRHMQSSCKAMKGGTVRGSTIKKLNPFMVDDIIRVGGRLQLSCLPFDTKHPIILPSKHFVTDRIVMHYHLQNAHAGITHVLNSLREEFWIPKGYSTVRRVLRQCYLCKRLNAAPCSQIMAPLPECRLKAHVPPFNSVGVDYFGPFFTKRGRAVEKRYGCLFTCLSIRAVHIEMAHTLDTDSFLCAFSRFAARRGYPEHIFSDNGSNFKGADASLKQIIRSWDKAKIANNLLEKGCEWHFNPPRASHRGGVWERVIRSVRRILRTLLFQKMLTDETLETFLVESEGILNNRPLVRLTGDGDEMSVLTPNKLLLLHKQLTFEGIEASRTSLYNKRWKEAQHLADLFWHRWLREYLPMLQTRSKWLDIRRNLQPGDLVLVNSTDTPRGLWPKAIVKQVYYDKDGRVRTVRLKTTTQEVVRDIRCVCLLEEADNLKVPDTQG